mmetsp:Transcript_1404/g.3558  ORF Transcript_1404/g.3558 Transcript_1404/m.3558 type:complete len:281 (-) Transcript_1404:152-994(-)
MPRNAGNLVRGRSGLGFPQLFQRGPDVLVRADPVKQLGDLRADHLHLLLLPLSCITETSLQGIEPLPQRGLLRSLRLLLHQSPMQHLVQPPLYSVELCAALVCGRTELFLQAVDPPAQVWHGVGLEVSHGGVNGGHPFTLLWKQATKALHLGSQGLEAAAAILHLLGHAILKPCERCRLPCLEPGYVVAQGGDVLPKGHHLLPHEAKLRLMDLNLLLVQGGDLPIPIRLAAVPRGMTPRDLRPRVGYALAVKASPQLSAAGSAETGVEAPAANLITQLGL